MDDRKDPILVAEKFTINSAKVIFRNRWAVMPVLLVGCWAYFLFNGVRSAIIMIAADICSIYVLTKYVEQINAMQWKRILLFLLDVPICIVFLFLGALFEDSEFLNSFYIIICPPALFLININTYRKNACDKKMFAALLFTDPLMHWMAVFVTLAVIEPLINPYW